MIDKILKHLEHLLGFLLFTTIVAFAGEAAKDEEYGVMAWCIGFAIMGLVDYILSRLGR